MPKAKTQSSRKSFKRAYGSGSLRQVGKEVWELGYRPPNAPKRLAKRIKASNRKAAEEQLAAWRRRLDRQPGHKVPVGELFELHLADLRREQRDSYNITMERNRIRKNLDPVFGALDASCITRSDITCYIDNRLLAGAKPSTINRELSALRRSFNLGIEHGLISGPPPVIKCLRENNVRKGFVEHEVYLRIMRALPRNHQMLWCFGYYLGIRKGDAWCPGRDLNPHSPCGEKEFKSFASADFATRALLVHHSRRGCGGAFASLKPRLHGPFTHFDEKKPCKNGTF